MTQKDAPETEQVIQRKADHIRINVEKDVSFKGLGNGFERYRFYHQALPELDLAEVETAVTVFGKQLATPLFISAMTGGTEEAKQINLGLAEGAQQLGMAMGLGSMRAAIENPGIAHTFQVRRVAPDILLFANVGAVQLNYGYGVAEMQKAVEIAQADALILHFNPLQEAVQPEGDGNFKGLFAKIEQVCRALAVPVIAKEVGWGFDERTARRLADAGISAIDVAGSGGTSWSQVEMYRAPTARHARIAGSFIDWGIPTAEAVQMCKQGAPHLPIFASGGLKNGIEIAKSIALGATLAGIAGDFLRAVVKGGVPAFIELAQTITQELKIAMFCAGAGSIAALQQTPLLSKELI